MSAAVCLGSLKEPPSNPQRTASVHLPETPGLLGGAELHFSSFAVASERRSPCV